MQKRIPSPGCLSFKAKRAKIIRSVPVPNSIVKSLHHRRRLRNGESDVVADFSWLLGEMDAAA